MVVTALSNWWEMRWTLEEPLSILIKCQNEIKTPHKNFICAVHVRTDTVKFEEEVGIVASSSTKDQHDSGRQDYCDFNLLSAVS